VRLLRLLTHSPALLAPRKGKTHQPKLNAVTLKVSCHLKKDKKSPKNQVLSQSKSSILKKKNQLSRLPLKSASKEHLLKKPQLKNDRKSSNRSKTNVKELQNQQKNATKNAKLLPRNASRRFSWKERKESRNVYNASQNIRSDWRGRKENTRRP